MNAFFTYSIVIAKDVPWQVALGMVFWSGVIFLIISLTPLRAAIVRAIPLQLRVAAAAGIGVLLSFIGFRNAGLVGPDPVTLLKLGDFGLPVLFFFLGLAIMALLLHRKSPLAFLGGIFLVSLAAIPAGIVNWPEQWLSWPDFGSVFFRLDFRGALNPALFPALMTLLVTDLFDSLSTFVGVSQATGLTDREGQPLHLRKGLLVDALATLSSGLSGTSPGTAYIESAAGIESGGRTGLTSVFTALCFLPCFFIAPLAAAVPAFATAPVLVLVGLLMFRSLTTLSLNRIEEALPAYLTVLLIPLTFSITQGILWGFISHVVLHLLVGRPDQVKPAMYALALVSLVLVVLDWGAF